MKLIIDKRLLDAKTVTFHPMKNDALIEITVDDFKKFIKEIGKTETVVDFVQLKKEMENDSKTEGKKEEKSESKKQGKKKKGGKPEEDENAEE